MDWIGFNTLLRDTITNIINLYDGDSGIRTTILKSLNGNQGVSTMNKWIDTSDQNKIYNLGIKPLIKVADSIGYELHIAFVPKVGQNIIQNKQYLDSLNTSFVEHSKQLIHNMVNQMNYSEIKYPSQNNVSKVVKNVIDEINYDDI
jgi:hypothetical protein